LNANLRHSHLDRFEVHQRAEPNRERFEHVPSQVEHPQPPQEAERLGQRVDDVVGDVERFEAPQVA
jgi:hypothetical protein